MVAVVVPLVACLLSAFLAFGTPLRRSAVLCCWH